ncbi:M23 family metallopeptidase [Azospirillum sp. ST 5-10]|uniref:M23 family metallopeptidase n=1 Tax=unclassified Azospirillum TaxID=2630922 RepID=UPI003F49D7E6
MFDIPIDCTLGKTCWVQNYVDQDPGPGRADYTCGRLSYDGHKGTDFRVADMPALERGVPVLAAAAGTVRAIRDGMDDVNVRTIGRDALKGRDAGNSVVVVHDDGWETQYAHMKRGSVRVKPGDRVAAGQALGLVGLSGNTEFPHVHFEARHDGAFVDPFVGTDDPPGCEGPRHPMWTPAAQQRLAYQPTAGLVAGFAASQPKVENAREGDYASERLPRGGAALVFWADVMGVLAGDEQRFRIDGPDGKPVFDRRDTIDDSKVSSFAFAGRRTPPGGWPPGTYSGRYTLTRDGATVVDMTRRVTLE